MELKRPRTNFWDWLMEREETEKYAIAYCPKRDELYQVENHIAVFNGKDYYIYGNGIDKRFGSWKQTKLCKHWVWLGYL